MGFAFNPFTGNFDLKGSGGGSAFFAGEVDTYADLPLDGTAALNSRWLVRSSSGVWPFPGYHQGGIYIRISTVGADRADDYLLADTNFPDVFSDAAFTVYDDADATKNLQFQLSGIDTATIRTLSVPNASGTIARTEDFAAPPAIGNTTPAAGSFTTLTASGETELVNGTNAAGPLRVYNTFTSATNHERGFLRWSSNVFQIGTEAGSGGGTARNLEFQTNGITRFTINTLGTATFSASIAAANFISAGAGIGISGRFSLGSPANASITMTGIGSQNTNFDLLRFGGVSSSYPALKRDTTTLQARLADDSDFTAIQGKLTTETAYTAGAPSTTGYLVLYDSNGTAYKVPAEAL